MLPACTAAVLLLTGGAVHAQTLALTHDPGTSTQQLAEVDAGGNLTPFGTGVAGCCNVAGALATLIDDEVVFIAEDAGAATQTLHVLDTTSGNAAGSVALPAGERLLGLRWDGDDNRLLGLARPDGGTDMGLRSINPATGASEVIGGAITDCCAVAVGVDVLDADNDIWYVVARLTSESDWRLISIDTDNGSILAQPVLTEVPVGLIMDGAQVQAAHHDAGTEVLATVDTATGALTDIGTGQAGCCRAAPGVITSDGASGLLVARPVPAGPFTLYELDPFSGVFTALNTVPVNRPITALFNSSPATGPQIQQGSQVGVAMDEDGSPTAFALILDATDPAMGGLTWNIDEQAGQGTASVTTGSGLSQDIAYIPSADANGPDSFVVRVEDSAMETDLIQVNVTINPVNDAPSLALQGDLSAQDLDGPQTVNGFVLVQDPGATNEANQTVSVTVSDIDNPGLFSSLPAIDGAGTLTFTPAQGASDSALVEVTATDDGGTANGGTNTTIESFTITIEPTPRADIAVALAANEPSAEPGQILVYTLQVSNNGPDDASDILVDNTLPGQLINASWNCSTSVGNLCGSGTGGVMDSIDIDASDTVTYTVTATVNAPEGEFIVNTVEVLPPSEPVDLDQGNNTATATLFIGLFTDGFETEDTDP